MLKDLFRTESLNRHRHLKHSYGDALLLPTLSHVIVTGVLLLWSVLFFIFLFFGIYKKKETVSGWIEPSSGVVRIYPEITGIIKEVHVSEGQFVERGNVLLTISNNLILNSGQNLEENLIQEYAIQEKILNEQLEREKTNFTEIEINLKSKINSVKSEIKLIDDQILSRQSQHRLLTDRLTAFGKLRKQGHLSQIEVDQAREESLEIYNEIKDMERLLISQKNAAAQLELDLLHTPTTFAKQDGLLREKLSSLQQLKTQIIGKSVQLIKAPGSGIISNLQAIQGQQVMLGSEAPMLTILPRDAQLKVHMLVPVRAAGFIEENQTVNIRYDAFPHQKFGMYKAKIENISKAIILPNELRNTPVVADGPAYRIIASLEKMSVTAYGKDFPLRSGMTLDADINLGDNSIINWIFDPIYSLQGRL
ncbi:MAG TPA: HlyD family efflux transporter periplasmic adaptor subunit [Cellvibrio sp.]|nr:HlyD family efflux transporter periplasmic adaptor subunit [Cellvibrio sp.]